MFEIICVTNRHLVSGGEEGFLERIEALAAAISVHVPGAGALTGSENSYGKGDNSCREETHVYNKKSCDYDEKTSANLKKFPASGIILREKDLPEDEYLKLAAKIAAICKKWGVLFIPHTHPITKNLPPCITNSDTDDKIAGFDTDSQTFGFDTGSQTFGFNIDNNALRNNLKNRDESKHSTGKWQASNNCLKDLGILSKDKTSEITCNITIPAVAEVAAYGENNLHVTMDALRKMPAIRRAEFDILGASVHSAAEAKEAEALGCTYVAAGHIFDTNCKMKLPGRGLEFLKEVCEIAEIPVYAIGGIDASNIALIKAAGASGVCVMSGAMTCENPAEYINTLRCSSPLAEPFAG